MVVSRVLVIILLKDIPIKVKATWLVWGRAGGFCCDKYRCVWEVTLVTTYVSSLKGWNTGVFSQYSCRVSHRQI